MTMMMTPSVVNPVLACPGYVATLTMTGNSGHQERVQDGFQIMQHPSSLGFHRLQRHLPPGSRTLETTEPPTCQLTSLPWQLSRDISRLLDHGGDNWQSSAMRNFPNN